MFPSPVLSFTNATLPDSNATTLRVVGERIAAIGEPPRARDAIIDCNGDWLLPGLINAHDHLELNNFPRLKWRERYDSAREWIADFQPRFTTDPALIATLSVPLDDRLLIGGLKNLLSGVTTVAHHNPLHRALRQSRILRHAQDASFPVRVAQRYGWAHSLGVDGDAKVVASYRRTPKDWPWIIHLAEGVDDAAARELSRLDALGCLHANTVIVHGVGLSDNDRTLLRERGAGLIWCPSSNLFMLGRTADMRALVVHPSTGSGCVALGSDSRLSGERDLLDELRVARDTGQMNDETLLAMVTTNAARLLRLTNVGALRVGALADLLVMSERSLTHHASRLTFHASRQDVRLVLLAGRARLAAPAYAHVFDATRTRAERITVDGCEKLLERSLVARLRQCRIHENGVDL